MVDASKLVTKALQGAALTAKALGRRMRISDSAIRRYGYGDRTPPPPLLKRLARVLRQQARFLQRTAGLLQSDYLRDRLLAAESPDEVREVLRIGETSAAV